MQSNGTPPSPDILHELADIPAKVCSRLPGPAAEVVLPESRNPELLEKLAAELRNHRLITIEDKQAIVDLAAALMTGELAIARRAVEKIGESARRLVYLRDVLAQLLVGQGFTAVQIMPTQTFLAPPVAGKAPEALYFTLKAIRTKEAVGIPSLASIDPQVFRTINTSNDAGLMQIDDRADCAVVFRRIAALLAHADTTAPPPWAGF